MTMTKDWMCFKSLMVGICLMTAFLLSGCSRSNTNAPLTESAGPASATQPGGVEKVKPAPGTGNVQGKVLYNGKPVPNIEVKLCETFNRFIGGCDGKTYTARTDNDGDYVITNVEPKVYEGLLARVFETDAYVFATTGIGGFSSAKYDVVADKTVFISPTNLFKGDLKLVNPKAGAKVNAENLELKWEPYADAAYYRLSINPEEATVSPRYVNERVEATLFKLDKPLEKGTYRWQVNAYNSADQKLAESASDIKFTVN